MFETLLITFREGLEAFLIVSIMLAYLTKTGRTKLIKPVYAGTIFALLISATTGWHIAELAQDPVWEGSLALIAGALVATFTIYIMKNARHIRQDIGEALERQAQKDSLWAMTGIFFVTTLMVAREGMETALMLGAISAQNEPASMIIGAILGLLSVALIGVLWLKQSHRINLRIFMQVTGIFLVLFSVHLFLYGLHELSEMQAIPFIGQKMNIAFHTLSEPIEGSLVSNLMAFGLLLVPTGWLLASFIKDRISPPKMIAAE